MPRSPYKLFETDPGLEQNGIRIDYGDFSITVRRAGGANRAWNAALDTALRTQRRITSNKEAAERLTRELAAKHLVIGWEGVTDRDGNEMPFTTENAIRLFTDLPDLFADVLTQANEIRNFLRDEVIADAKKLPSGSVTHAESASIREQ